MWSFGTVGETQEPYETGEKMEMAKQDTTKTWHYPARRPVLWWQASYQKPKEIMMWMTKPHFSIFNRLNFHFQGIPHHNPRALQLWILIMYLIYAYYSRDY